MEKEKRKKASPEENDGGVVEETKKKKKKARKEEKETASASAAEVEVEEPTMEEVEEFYAILRRMDVALRYLKGAQKRLSERRTTAEETAAVRTGEVGENKELNLNEVPADSTN